MATVEYARNMFLEGHPDNLVIFFKTIGTPPVTTMTELLNILQQLSNLPPLGVNLDLEVDTYKAEVAKAIINYQRMKVAMAAVYCKVTGVSWHQFEANYYREPPSPEEWKEIHAWWNGEKYMLHNFVPNPYPVPPWSVTGFSVSNFSPSINPAVISPKLGAGGGKLGASGSVGSNYVVGTITFYNEMLNLTVSPNIKMGGPSFGLGFSFIPEEIRKFLLTEIRLSFSFMLRFPKIATLLTKITSGSIPGVGLSKLPGAASGLVADKERTLTEGDFKGWCICIAPLNASAGIWNYGFHVLFFGITSFNPVLEMIDIIRTKISNIDPTVILPVNNLGNLLEKLEYHSKGVAVFNTGYIAIPSGAEINCVLYIGKIS